MHSDHRVSPAVSPTDERPNNRVFQSQEQESPAELIRNALQLLRTSSVIRGVHVMYNLREYRSIDQMLVDAAKLLEAAPAPADAAQLAFQELSAPGPRPQALEITTYDLPRFEVTELGRAELEHMPDCGVPGCPTCKELRAGWDLPQGVRPAFAPADTFCALHEIPRRVCGCGR